MNNTYLSSRFGGTLYRAFHYVHAVIKARRIRRVRLIADDTVVKSYLFKVSRILNVIRTEHGMVVGDKAFVFSVVLCYVKHGKIPCVKAGFCDKLDRLFVADDKCGRTDFR